MGFIIGLFSFIFEIGIWAFIISAIVKAVRKSAQNDSKNTERKDISDERQQQRRYNTGNRPGAGDLNGPDREHNHAYKHKVEPVKTATVVKEHQIRKQQQEQKRRTLDAMYKEGTTGYKSDVTNGGVSENQSVSRGYERRDDLIQGKNGDYGTDISTGEQSVVCGYCGANNILPRGVVIKKYSCYFCRQQL